MPTHRLNQGGAPEPPSLPLFGIGLAPLGGLYHPVTPADALEALSAAWELGFRYFDVAPLYGNGSAEQLLGQAAATWDEPYTISTKVGRLLRPDGVDPGYYFSDSQLRPRFDFTRLGVGTSLRESLTRLGRESVDIAFVHDPDDFSDTAIRESLPELRRLRDEGMIGALGVGMNQWQAALRILRQFPLDVVLIAGRYSLLDQTGLPLLEECLRRGTTVVAAGVFNSGALASADGQPITYDYRPADPDIARRVNDLRRACADFGVPLRAAALHFPLTHPATTTVLVGVRSRTEVEQLHQDLQQPIPNELWTHLQRRGLLDERVPLNTPAREGIDD